MKTIITTAVCSSLLLLSGCNDKQENKTASAKGEQQQTVQQKKIMDNKSVAPLLSGINTANMDKSVRPQDNFYEYINGDWLKTHSVPADKTSLSSFSELRDEASSNVKTIIEKLSATPNLKMGSDEQKVADLFRSFMNTDKLNSLGTTPIAPIFADINKLTNKHDLAEFFGKNQASGIDSPLAVYVSVDAKNSSRYASHIWQSGLGLPDRDYYFNKKARFVKIRKEYVQHIANMFKLAGLKNGEQAAKTIMAIETNLAKYQWTRVQNRNSTKRYNKFKLDKLNTLTNNFDWQAFLTAAEINKQQDIIINQPDFIKGFGEVFNKTSLADWKSYLTFHVLSDFASYLSANIDNENFNFYSKQLSGRQEQRPRWKRGVSVVNGNLGEVIGKIYVKEYFTPKAKQRMSQLVENLRKAYGESVDDLSWMSPATKKAAHVKLAAFTPKIGYPDRWKDYSGLQIKEDDLVGNIIRSRQFTYQQQIDKLDDPIHKWEWGMTPQTVNAYYNPTVNEIVFPAAILQPPFFNMKADDAANYGGIGAVIGHEMGHGFDDQGSKYDAKGNLHNWWTKQDLAAFSKRTKALINQYNGYQVFKDLHVNGALTLGENIGDLSGITIAYRAYHDSLKGKKAPIIDGLTGDQRFFMSFAQIWRGKMVEKSLRNLVATNPHAPGEFRALGALSNTPQFYKAFNVKPGDKMYIAPDKRVKIW